MTTRNRDHARRIAALKSRQARAIVADKPDWLLPLIGAAAVAFAIVVLGL